LKILSVFVHIGKSNGDSLRILADVVRRSPQIKKPTCAKASVGEGGERGIGLRPSLKWGASNKIKDGALRLSFFFPLAFENKFSTLAEIKMPLSGL
jgi:hypothetical protein